MTGARLLSLAFWLSNLAAITFASQPWDKPFAASTAEIAKSAAAVPVGDADVALLLDDHHYAIQKDGKTISTYRRVYRVMTANALDDWATVEQEWEPWHEVRPELRARVISPDGTVHWLDQKTIADAPVAQYDSTIFSDAKVSRAPLPAVAVGAVIEYEIVQTDTAPLFAAGVSHDLTVNAFLPVERFHVSIDAAKGIDLRTGTSLIPQSGMTRAESKAGTHIDVELSWRKVEKDLEFSVPADQPQHPAFRFSTGASWQAIAAAYEQIVSKQTSVDNSVLRDLGLSGMPKFGSAREAAERLAAVLHQHVRYTGVEFGQAAIVPNPARDVVNRHYGDCKDKAALLMMLLRSAGFDAHLALLQAGEGEDIDPELPGFGLFNHAIIFIGGKQPLWIDATADTARIGTLPIGDQGRLALIVDGSTSALTKTPGSSAADNRIIHNVEVKLSEHGKGSIGESLEASGNFELQMRSAYGGNEHEVHAAVERLAKYSFGGDSLGAFQVTKKDDFSQPFRLTLQAKNSSAAMTTLQDAAVRVTNGLLFESLPYGLAPGFGSNQVEHKARKQDFVVQVPYHAEVHFKIFPPSGFSPRQLPAPQHFRLSAANYSSESKRNADGTVQLDYQFELTGVRLRPDEFESLRADLKKYVESSGQLVAFAYRGSDLIAIGKTGEALQMAQKSVREHPEDALAQMRFSQLLIEGGAGQAAVTAAKRAVEQDPKSARGWFTLASAYEHDSFGRLRTGDWNPIEAEKALRKAIELDDADLEAKTELAILLEHDKTGERYRAGARVAEAIAVYGQVLKKSPNPAVSHNLAIALMHLDHFTEAQEELQKAGQQPAHGALNIALTALIENPEKAIISNQTESPDNSTRSQHLAQAGMILNQLRKYEAGSELLAAAERLNGDPQAQQVLRFYGSTQPWEKAIERDDDPKAPVKRFLILAAKNSSTPEEISGIISKHADPAVWQARLEQARNSLGLLRVNLLSGGGSSDALADLLISHSKIETTDNGKADELASPPLGAVVAGRSRTVVVQRMKPVTDAAGHVKPVDMVTVTSQMNLGLLTFFVVREEGQSKLLASGDGLESIGRQALDALAKGDLTTAQGWLDAAKNNALPQSPRDDKGPAIRFLWAGTAPETRNTAFAKAAAASLLGTYGGSSEAVSILKQMTEHPAQYMERDDLNFAICEALEKAQNWKDLRDASEPLLKSRFYQEPGMRFKGEALAGLEDWPGLAKITEARLVTSPKDHNALQFAAIAAMRRSDFDSAAKYVTRSKTAPYAAYLPDDLLEQWSAILSGKVSSDTLKGSDNGDILAALRRGSAYAYTLALAQLRNGKVDDCHRSLTLALNMDGANPSGLAWLVQGELLKQYSLDSAAASAFERARSSRGYERLEFAKVLLRQ